MKIAGLSPGRLLLPAAALPILFVLIFNGVGDVFLVSLSGLLLCAAGLLQKSPRPDLKIFIPFILYCLVSLLSAFNVYGTIASGSYVPKQLLFPTLYLLMASLGRRQRALLRQMCVFFAVIAAGVSLGQFTGNAVFFDKAGRLGGVLGNPNALGIFLVISWFALMHAASGQKEEYFFFTAILPHLEPLLLAALALTLSMGSFAAMAAGILAILIKKKRQASFGEVFRYACRSLAKVSLGVGSGVLLYLTAARTDAPWFCLILLLYIVALAAFWKKLDLFLGEYSKAAAAVSLGGFFVAAVIMLSRPSSVETFVERLEMMRNGIHYLLRYPVLGIGPGQWRIYNRFSNEKYFNTWYIHNSLIHVGAELGVTAMALLLAVVVRILKKDLKPWAKAGCIAFFFHNLIDTVFFHTGAMTLAIVAFCEPDLQEKELKGHTAKLLFGAFALVFFYNLCFYIIKKG